MISEEACSIQMGFPTMKAEKIAAPILSACGFSDRETEEILEAIGGHRDVSVKTGKDLAGILYRADKRSRCCFSCPAEAECNWSMEKKNMRLTV